MITSLSPLDGRYAGNVADLSGYFSEYALIRHRLMVEVAFFMTLSSEPGIPELPPFSDKELNQLEEIIEKFDEKEAEKVKKIEETTRHDVKAVEYYLKGKLEKTTLKKHLEFIHFACTSEDINNLALALMIKGGVQEVLLPALNELNKKIVQLSTAWRKVSLLSLTHGQPASPTTAGKEMAVFAARLKRQIGHLERQEFLGKLNGATGNFNAHISAYPKVKWSELSKNFVQNLGLSHNPLTTQIESHDYQSELFDTIARTNAILTDLCQDVWLYISRGVFSQKAVAGEVGSSTMPHKVNPIDFENAEGNFGLANSLLRHLSQKLPVSRLQRDLTDSTVQRNIGVAFGYSLLAYKSLLKGLGKLDLNKKIIQFELDENWALLAEPIQTVMRKHGFPEAYEKLKSLTRGKEVNKKIVQDFIKKLNIPKEDKDRLLKLSPATYIGLAGEI